MSYGQISWSGDALKDFALEYFYNFSHKNLESISNKFDDNIFLEDWENFAAGKEEVIAVYKKIFDSVDSISVTPKKLYTDDNTVIAQLLIRINGKEDIFVADVITYDSETGLIKAIQAYKG